MNQQTTTKTMTIGRALHMDLTRADDAKLEAAFRVLNDYEDSGKASAWTLDKFDDRIQDIFDETDRRAGFEPVYVPRQPLYHAAPVEPDADTDGEEDAPDAEELRSDPSVRREFETTGMLPGLSSAI